jgi:hypothetical protein
MQIIYVVPQPRRFGAHFPGLAPVYWHPHEDGEDFVLLLCSLLRKPDVSANRAENLLSLLVWLSEAAL